MKTLCVLQHVEGEYLGLMEEHFESRAIGFRYVRPFTPGAVAPASTEDFAGLIVLGAGPLGIVSGNLVPSLGLELRLAGEFLRCRLPVVGIGFGACLLAVAAGGGAEEAPLRCSIETAVCTDPHALCGHLPDRYPVAVYLRDRPVLPDHAVVLAKAMNEEPLLFQIRDNALGFLGHPGMKAGMVEDLIMAFEQTPEGAADMLTALRNAQDAISASLREIMVGLIKLTHLMEPS